MFRDLRFECVLKFDYLSTIWQMIICNRRIFCDFQSMIWQKWIEKWGKHLHKSQNSVQRYAVLCTLANNLSKKVSLLVEKPKQVERLNNLTGWRKGLVTSVPRRRKSRKRRDFLWWLVSPRDLFRDFVASPLLLPELLLFQK